MQFLNSSFCDFYIPAFCSSLYCFSTCFSNHFSYPLCPPVFGAPFFSALSPIVSLFGGLVKTTASCEDQLRFGSASALGICKIPLISTFLSTSWYQEVLPTEFDTTLVDDEVLRDDEVFQRVIFLGDMTVQGGVTGHGDIGEICFCISKRPLPESLWTWTQRTRSGSHFRSTGYTPAVLPFACEISKATF